MFFFCGNYRFILCFILLIDNVALARWPKSTVLYTINESAVRAFPNESKHTEKLVVVSIRTRIFSHINMRNASPVEPLRCLGKEAFISTPFPSTTYSTFEK